MLEPLYHCAGCRRAVVVVVDDDGKTEFFRPCSCDAPIVGNMSAQATGTGGMKAKTAV